MILFKGEKISMPNWSTNLIKHVIWRSTEINYRTMVIRNKGEKHQFNCIVYLQFYFWFHRDHSRNPVVFILFLSSIFYPLVWVKRKMLCGMQSIKLNICIKLKKIEKEIKCRLKNVVCLCSVHKCIYILLIKSILIYNFNSIEAKKKRKRQQNKM